MMYDYFLVRNSRWVVGVRNSAAFTLYGTSRLEPRHVNDYDSGWVRAEFAPRALPGDRVYNLRARKWDTVSAIKWSGGYHYFVSAFTDTQDFLFGCS